MKLADQPNWNIGPIGPGRKERFPWRKIVGTFQATKIVSNTVRKIFKIAIFHCIQKWFVPSGPDFYAIFKMGLKFSVPLKLTKLLSNL